MEMIVGRYTLMSILLVMLISTPFVATVTAQEDEEGHVAEASENENGTEEFEITDVEDVELPIGLELAARFHELMEAHKAEIRTIIEQFKFDNSQNHEERLGIIEAYHNEARLRLEDMKTERKGLLAAFHDGTIDHDAFVARMRLLKAGLKGSERIADKLGWQLSEVAKKAAEQHKHKALMLKELNQQMRDEMKAVQREMKEEVKSRGPSWRTSGTTTETSTSAWKKGGGRGKGGNKDSPDVEPGEES